MTLPRSSLKEIRKQEARKSRKQWMTSFGWRNRGRMDSLEVNRHPLCPDASKVAELMIVSIWLLFLGEDSRCILPLKGKCQTHCSCRYICKLGFYHRELPLHPRLPSWLEITVSFLAQAMHWMLCCWHPSCPYVTLTASNSCVHLVVMTARGHVIVWI